MYLAYIDESGDKGVAGSRSYTLGVVLLPAQQWPTAFDDLIAFRRWVKQQFGVPVRAELKANYLLSNKGPLRARPLSESARFGLYRSHMRLLPKIGARAFAVVIRKAELWQRDPSRDPFEVAWEYAFQRLERFTTKGNTHVLVVHDEGDSLAIRKLARKARRAGRAGSAFGTGTLSRPTTRLIDDPVPRVSTHSYFLQLADLCAYAAFRVVYPPPTRAVPIVPSTMWDEMGAARFAPASSLVGRSTPGIVVYPR